MATQHISNGGTAGAHHTNSINYNENALVELNETISRLSSHQGVEIVQVLNKNGDIVMESSSSQQQQQSSPTPQQQQQQQQNYSSISSSITQNGSNDDEAVGTDGIGSGDAATIANGSTAATTAANIQHALFTKHMMELATTYFHTSGSNNTQNAAENSNQDQVSFIHVRSKNGKELMISPHDGFVLTVLKR